METENVTKAKLRDFVELFTQLRSKVSKDEIALAMFQEIGKDGRVERMRSSSVQNGTNGDQPATDRQINYLASLGVDVPAGLTKKAASELIDQHAT